MTRICRTFSPVGDKRPRRRTFARAVESTRCWLNRQRISEADRRAILLADTRELEIQLRPHTGAVKRLQRFSIRAATAAQAFIENKGSVTKPVRYGDMMPLLKPAVSSGREIPARRTS